MMAHCAFSCTKMGESATAIFVACCSETFVGTPFFGCNCATSGAGVPYAGYGIGVTPAVGIGCGVGIMICPLGALCAKPVAGTNSASANAMAINGAKIGFISAACFQVPPGLRSDRALR